MFKFLTSKEEFWFKTGSNNTYCQGCGYQAKGCGLSLRISYIGNAFKYNELGGGKQKEFTQAGVEIIGVNTPEADAEVIATAIDAVKATGLENFQIDIGQVEFSKADGRDRSFGRRDGEDEGAYRPKRLFGN